MADDGPVIPASVTLPETTVKALLLGALLAVVLGAANAYVGLRVGMTVSASIPAAVISMGVFKVFKDKNILENNIVQTAASAGEALAAGVIFTIPALLVDFQGQPPIWEQVDIAATFVIAALGGALGVLFTVPLRRALIVEAELPFPEGIAAAEVLESGQEGGSGIRFLAAAIVVSGLYALLQTGLRLWEGAVQGARRVGGTLAYFGSNIAPILLGVGYIVGPQIAMLVFLGGALGWLVLIPIFGVLYGVPAGDPVQAAFAIWDARIRLVGAGAMITGGAWTLIQVRHSLAAAVGQARRAFQGGGDGERLRTEQDLPYNRVFLLIALLVIPIFGVYWSFTGDPFSALVAAIVMVIAGFFFSSVAGYMAGVVGSSNNPISGVTIVTLLFASLLLAGMAVAPGAASQAALGVAAVIASAGAIAGDNLQDLKTGFLVGSTPKRQQMVQIVGVFSFALIAPFTLVVLDRAFEIGSRLLPAPQAILMRTIVAGVFQGNLDWGMIGLGMAIAAGIIVLDEAAKRVSDMRFHVMAVAVGLYLPLELSVPIFIGGLLRLASDRVLDRHDPGDETRSRVRRHGTLLGSGLIAGEAIMGIMIAGLIMVATLPSFGVLPNPLEVVIPPGFPPGGANLFVQQVIVVRFAPAIAAVLLAGAFYILGDAFPRSVRRLGTAVIFLSGVAASAVMLATGVTFNRTVAPGLIGLPLFAFIALLLVYAPLRELVVEES